MAVAVTFLALEIVREEGGVVPPIALLKVISPAPAVNPKWTAPLTVPARVILLPPESKSQVWVSDKAEAICSVPVVVTSAPMKTPPALVCAKVLLEVKLDPKGMVRVPALLIAIGPPPVVVTGELKRKFVPVKLMPLAVVVLTAPLKVAVPEEDINVRGPATVMALEAITSVALTMTKLVGGVELPTAPCKLTLPVPPVKLNGKAPLIACDSVIEPAPAPLLREDMAVRVMGEAMLKVAFDVVIELPRETVPAPVCVKAPAMEKTEPGAIVKLPEFVMPQGPPPAVVTLLLNTN